MSKFYIGQIVYLKDDPDFCMVVVSGAFGEPSNPEYRLIGFHVRQRNKGNIACICKENDLMPEEEYEMLKQSKEQEKQDYKHPSYYNVGRIEVIDFIQDKKLNFALGNVVKYVCRAGLKNNESKLKDLKKARNYIDFEIAEAENAVDGTESNEA